MPLLKRSAQSEMQSMGAVSAAADALKQDTPTAEQLAQVETVKKSIAKAAAGEIMTKKDWQDKDNRISRAGVWQACMHSVGLLQLNVGNTLEDYLNLVEKAADAGYEYIHRT